MKTILLGLVLWTQVAMAAGAPYCVVTPWGLQCWYQDLRQCQRAAEMAKSVCVVNPDWRG